MIALRFIEEDPDPHSDPITDADYRDMYQFYIFIAFYVIVETYSRI
jgi:hypothetical protein